MCLDFQHHLFQYVQDWKVIKIKVLHLLNIFVLLNIIITTLFWKYILSDIVVIYIICAMIAIIHEIDFNLNIYLFLLCVSLATTIIFCYIFNFSLLM